MQVPEEQAGAGRAENRGRHVEPAREVRIVVDVLVRGAIARLQLIE